MTVFVAFHQSKKGTKNGGQKADEGKEGISNFRIQILFDSIEKECEIRGIFLDGRDVDLV